jgi:hypothetical protein
MSVTQNYSVTLRKRSAEAGIWCWGLCDVCHRATSPWDDEFLLFSKVFAHALLHSDLKGTRTAVGGQLSNLRPGRFIRSAVAGMVGWAGDLTEDEPAVAAAVLHGPPSRLDLRHRVLLGVTPVAEVVAVHAGHRGIAVSASGDSLDVASVAIHFPPFSFVIASESAAMTYPHADITDWLALSTDEVVDHLPVGLPAIRLRNPQPWSGIATADGYESGVV